MAGIYQQMREAKRHQREEDHLAYKQMKFTAQDLEDLQVALTAMQPQDETTASRLQTLQRRISGGIVALQKRSEPEANRRPPMLPPVVDDIPF
jgi:hypothetical protein